MYIETTEKLLEFISKSPTAFQAAEETRRRFLEEGFTELKEEERWELEKGGKYFVMRNHSAIIGFSIPVNDCRRYHIIASHSDSPSFKIKENPEMSVNGAYVKLNVERYGGMILSTWFDRPLSVAGRMIVRKNGKILEKLVNIDRDLVMIPSLAIHMNRDIRCTISILQQQISAINPQNGCKNGRNPEPLHRSGHDYLIYFSCQPL